jgi:hypothetical protein
MCEPTTLRCDRVLAYTVLAVRSEGFARRLRGDHDPSAQAFFNAIRTPFADPITRGSAAARWPP